MFYYFKEVLGMNIDELNNLTDDELIEVILGLLDALGLVTEEADGHTQAV